MGELEGLAVDGKVDVAEHIEIATRGRDDDVVV
jgi:hypothetical protein